MRFVPGISQRVSEGSKKGRKLWFLSLLLLSIVLLVVGRKDSHIVQVLRQQVADLAAPALELASGPADRVRRVAANVGSYRYMTEEIARLRRENEELQAWRVRAKELEGTVVRFEALLNVSHEPEVSFVTARVIADVRGPFVQTIIVNAGTEQGVREAQAVLDESGLVGRTITAGADASRVLMLTDLNSRIPVRIEPSGYRAILTGTNQAQPRLDFLPAHATPKDGDLVYTSGDGGQLPPGLAVGTVRIDGAGAVRVEPFVDPSRLRFVRILDYRPSLSLDAHADMGGEAAEGQLQAEASASIHGAAVSSE